MPGTRSFFAACVGFALLLLIAVPAFSGLFAPCAVPDDAGQGFHIWQADDCAGCHMLVGQGGGYAPDLTRIYSLRGEAYLREFLLNPDTFTANANRTISHIALPDEELSPLLAFLNWTDENTGDFPPKPDGEIGKFPLKPDEKPDSSP